MLQVSAAQLETVTAVQITSLFVNKSVSGKHWSLYSQTHENKCKHNRQHQQLISLTSYRSSNYLNQFASSRGR